MAKLFCSDKISEIENYKEANKSKKFWYCKHLLEINGAYSREELKCMGLYWNRPANELIFLSKE